MHPSINLRQQTQKLEVTWSTIKYRYTIEQTKVLNTATKVSWSFQERYKNVFNLHTQLSTQLHQDLPQFPGKKFFGNLDPEFISTRKAALQNYFKILLQVVDVENTPTLLTFLTRGESKALKESTLQQSENRAPDNAAQINQQQQQNQLQKKKQDQAMQARIQMKHQLKEVCDRVSNNFIDLTQMMQAPEEEQIKKRRIQYDQIKIEAKTNNIDLPRCNPDSKTLVPNTTLDYIEPNVFQLLESLQQKLDEIIQY